MEHEYSEMTPISRQAFNVCYYCGCEATEIDYCPPLKFASLHRSQFDFAEKLKVPCCYECIDFLKTCSAASLEERMQFSKDKIANKYQTALRIYEMWTEKEASTVGVDLQTSINAGLSLGEEAYKRIKFRGFAYEVDGVITHQSNQNHETYEVFGEVFYDFRDALDYASRSYRIPKNSLKEMYTENGNNFNNAINSFHKALAEKEHQRQMKSYCGQFAKEFKQPIKFVSATVQKFLDEDESLTIPEALDRLAQRLKLKTD